MMIERISVVALSLCIAACASSGTEAPASDAMAPSAEVDTVAANAPNPAESVIDDIDAPNVEQTAAVAPDGDADEIVCRREIITGTRMSHRVCRRRSDIEAMEDESQEALRKMRQSGSQLEKGVAN